MNIDILSFNTNLRGLVDNLVSGSGVEATAVLDLDAAIVESATFDVVTTMVVRVEVVLAPAGQEGWAVIGGYEVVGRAIKQEIRK